MRQQHNTPRLQQLLETIWYTKGVRAWLGKYLLAPLSALFCILAQLKRYRDSRQQAPLTIPVIVVGNISIGGTGKTPLIIYLAKLLTTAGYKPCIITRGYKGTATDWPLLVGHEVPVQACGDEAKLMSQTTRATVIAGADRVADIRYAQEHTVATIILSDDGLQHYRMQRDMEIAVVDAQRLVGNGYCLPAGPLREPVSRLSRCDYVILNGDPRNTTQGIPLPSHTTYHMHLAGNVLVNLITNETKSVTEFDKVHIVTAIGNPQRFIQTLTSMGLQVIDQHLFPDHHYFSINDFNIDRQLPVIMTEKDIVKCENMMLENTWYLPVTAHLETGFEDAFLERVATLFSKKS